MVGDVYAIKNKENGKVHVGRFGDKESAIKARKRAEEELSDTK